MFRHEINRIGIGHFTRNNQISLILAIFIVDENDHATLGYLRDKLLR